MTIGNLIFREDMIPSPLGKIDNYFACDGHGFRGLESAQEMAANIGTINILAVCLGLPFVLGETTFGCFCHAFKQQACLAVEMMMECAGPDKNASLFELCHNDVIKATIPWDTASNCRNGLSATGHLSVTYRPLAGHLVATQTERR